MLTMSMQIDRGNLHLHEARHSMSCHPCAGAMLISCIVPILTDDPRRESDIACHVMSCHVMSCHDMSCHVMARHGTARHVISCLGCMIAHKQYIHVATCMYIYIYIYIHKNIYLSIYIYTHIHTYISLSVLSLLSLLSLSLSLPLCNSSLHRALARHCIMRSRLRRGDSMGLTAIHKYIYIYIYYNIYIYMREYFIYAMYIITIIILI